MQKHGAKLSNSNLFYFIMGFVSPLKHKVFHKHAVFCSSQLLEHLIISHPGSTKAFTSRLLCPSTNPLGFLWNSPPPCTCGNSPTRCFSFIHAEPQLELETGASQAGLPQLPKLELCCCYCSLAADPGKRLAASASLVPASPNTAVAVLVWLLPQPPQPMALLQSEGKNTSLLYITVKTRGSRTGWVSLKAQWVGYTVLSSELNCIASCYSQNFHLELI